MISMRGAVPGTCSSRRSSRTPKPIVQGISALYELSKDRQNRQGHLGAAAILFLLGLVPTTDSNGVQTTAEAEMHGQVWSSRNYMDGAAPNEVVRGQRVVRVRARQ